MQITVGSYVRIDEQCRTRAVRGLLCRVQALQCRRLSAFVPTQFAKVRVLGLEVPACPGIPSSERPWAR